MTQEEKREDEGKDGIVRSDRVEEGEEMEQGKRKRNEVMKQQQQVSRSAEYEGASRLAVTQLECGEGAWGVWGGK